MIDAHQPVGLALLVVAGLVAGSLNAVAGGGSLISFPSLVGLGLSDKVANATNSLALCPGSISGALGFRDRFAEVRDDLKSLWLPTTLGSVAGTAILLNTSDRAFQIAVPGLIIFATLLLALQPRIKELARHHNRQISRPVGVFFQFLISVYGGYFGAGMGILMLAYLGLMLDGDIHSLNALKGWLATIINVVASAVFLVGGLVDPLPCAAVLVGSVIGGFSSAKLSQKLNPDAVRWFVVFVGFVLAVLFGIRAWRG